MTVTLPLTAMATAACWEPERASPVFFSTQGIALSVCPAPMRANKASCLR